MSWSVSYSSRATFDANSPASESPTGAATAPELADQVGAAREAATAVIASGAVGDPAGDYMVFLNGHANPEHRPTPGWANDCVGVNVTQKS